MEPVELPLQVHMRSFFRNAVLLLARSRWEFWLTLINLILAGGVLYVSQQSNKISSRLAEIEQHAVRAQLAATQPIVVVELSDFNHSVACESVGVTYRLRNAGPNLATNVRCSGPMLSKQERIIKNKIEVQMLGGTAISILPTEFRENISPFKSFDVNYCESSVQDTTVFVHFLVFYEDIIGNPFLSYQVWFLKLEPSKGDSYEMSQLHQEFGQELGRP